MQEYSTSQTTPPETYESNIGRHTLAWRLLESLNGIMFSMPDLLDYKPTEAELSILPDIDRNQPVMFTPTLWERFEDFGPTEFNLFFDSFTGQQPSSLQMLVVPKDVAQVYNNDPERIISAWNAQRLPPEVRWGEVNWIARRYKFDSRPLFPSEEPEYLMSFIDQVLLLQDVPIIYKTLYTPAVFIEEDDETAPIVPTQYRGLRYVEITPPIPIYNTPLLPLPLFSDVEALTNQNGFTSPYDIRHNHRADLSPTLITQDIGVLIGRVVNSFVDHGGEWDHQPYLLKELARSLITNPSQLGGTIFAATGTGKTELEIQMIRLLTEAGYSLIIHVTPQVQALTQAHGDFLKAIGEKDCLRWYGDTKNLIKADAKVISTTYDSVEQLCVRLHERGLTPTVFMFDEGHHLRLDRQDLLEIPMIARTCKIALTATPGTSPHSLQERGLPIATSYPITEAIARRTLAPLVINMLYFSPQEISMDAMPPFQASEEHIAHLLEDTSDRGYTHAVVDIILQHCAYQNEDGQTDILLPTIVEAMNIEHAEQLYTLLIQEGNFTPEALSHIAIISSSHSHLVNSQLIDAARRGELKILIAIGMLTESINLPRMANLIMRPHNSSREHDQVLGRILRKLPFKLARVFQLFDTPWPELMGYRTVRQLLNLTETHPQVVFLGRREEYQSKVEEAKKYERQQKVILPSRCYPIEKLIVSSPKEHGLQLGMWSAIENKEDLPFFLASIFKRYTPDSGLPYPEPLILKALVTGGTRWHIEPSRFREMFGVRLFTFTHRFVGLKVIEMIQTYERQFGIDSVSTRLASPQNLAAFINKNIPKGAVRGAEGHRQTIKTLFRSSEGAINRVIKLWIDQELLPKEIRGIQSFVSYCELGQLLRENAAKFHLSFPDLGVTNFPKVADVIQKFKEQFGDFLAQRIFDFYQEHGYYFRSSRFTDEKAKRIYHFTNKEITDFVRELKQLTAKMLMLDDEASDDLASDSYFGGLLDLAEQKATVMGAVITPYPYDEYDTAFTFMVARAQRYMQLGNNFHRNSFTLDDKHLEPLFGILEGHLKAMCGRWDITPRMLIQKVALAVDETYRYSCEIYNQESLVAIAASVAQHIKLRHSMFTGPLHGNNFRDFAPPIPKQKELGLDYATYHGPSHEMKLFCKKHNIARKDFLQLINQELAKLN